jgi:branched-chain amino acid transport system ATP-binding protein
MTAALEIQNLNKSFGALAVARDINLALPKGARHALIGPNGAGKTTLVNLITGLLRPSAGRVLLDGQDITALPQAARTRRGIARTFQINQLFRGLTVLENLYLAVAERMHASGRLWASAGAEREVIDQALAQLEALRLADDALRLVRELPYGRQRLVEIAIALAQHPRVLLLDEPAAGVPESERHDILAAVAALPRDVTVLLIEHDMDLVFSFADRISVLVNGALLVEGPPEEVARDPQVKAVYLGEAADA